MLAIIPQLESGIPMFVPIITMAKLITLRSINLHREKSYELKQLLGHVRK